MFNNFLQLGILNRLPKPMVLNRQVCVQECLMREEMRVCGCVRPDYEFAEYVYPQHVCAKRQRGEYSKNKPRVPSPSVTTGVVSITFTIGEQENVRKQRVRLGTVSSTAPHARQRVFAVLFMFSYHGDAGQLVGKKECGALIESVSQAGILYSHLESICNTLLDL